MVFPCSQNASELALRLIGFVSVTSEKGCVVNYVPLEHTGRGCPVKAQAGLCLNEVPQTKARKDIIVPEFLSLVASVQHEAELSLGAGAGSPLYPATFECDQVC